MNTNEFVAASEERNEIPESGWTRNVIVAPGVRLFRVSDEIAAKTLFDWSPPMQLKMTRLDDGTYELIARELPDSAASPVPEEQP